MPKPTEATDIQMWFTCPATETRVQLHWERFTEGLAWLGDPDRHVIAHGHCTFFCPRCGQKHVITLPDNT